MPFPSLPFPQEANVQFSLDQVRHYMRQLLAGLSYCHEKVCRLPVIPQTRDPCHTNHTTPHHLMAL
jgi:serine/threonine protein kinase